MQVSGEDNRGQPLLRRYKLALGELNGNTAYLSEIKLSLLFVGYTLDLDERSVGFGIALAASMAQDTALAIRPK
jgi:hypothetical protein